MKPEPWNPPHEVHNLDVFLLDGSQDFKLENN